MTADRWPAWRPIAELDQDGRWIVIWGEIISNSTTAHAPYVVRAKADKNGWFRSPFGGISYKPPFWADLPPTMPLPPPPEGEDA